MMLFDLFDLFIIFVAVVFVVAALVTAYYIHKDELVRAYHNGFWDGWRRGKEFCKCGAPFVGPHGIDWRTLPPPFDCCPGCGKSV